MEAAPALVGTDHNPKVAVTKGASKIRITFTLPFCRALACSTTEPFGQSMRTKMGSDGRTVTVFESNKCKVKPQVEVYAGMIFSKHALLIMEHKR